jgi:hypothetical protein
MAKNFDDTYKDMYLNTMYPSAPKMGRGGVTPAQSAAAGGLEVPLKGLADTGASVVKGAVQGFIGLPGDIESLSYGVKEILKRGANEGVLDAFLRGLSEKTIAPTTEEVKKWLDTNVGKVGDGNMPTETIGELVSPGGYIKGAKKVAQGAKAAAKAVKGAIE